MSASTLTNSNVACATKIVATAGPATDGIEGALVAAGVSVFRINFSHGNADEHRHRVMSIRAAGTQQRRHVAILGDLQGPKIRIGQFANNKGVILNQGQTFTIDANLESTAGDAQQVSTTYQALSADCEPGDLLVIGDGNIELCVTASESNRVVCEVTVGGPLSANKGINKRGGGLSAGALTDKDKVDIHLAAELDVDYLAVSFPNSAADMHSARELAQKAKLNCQLVAKIERAETVRTDERLDELIEASDVVMIARGDLGIEIGYAALMGVQKRIALRARALNRPIITATQMMESMIENSSPTRAEVLDVANAVLDGTDAVMLSGETAVGKHPVTVVEAVADVLRGAETTAQELALERRAVAIDAVDNSIALAVMSIARRLNGVSAIACFTTSGNTPRLMSRYMSHIPIYAMVQEPKTLAWVALYRGVQPVLFKPDVDDYDSMNAAAVQWLRDNQVVKSGERVIVAKGDLTENRVAGGTNTLKVIEIS